MTLSHNIAIAIAFICFTNQLQGTNDKLTIVIDKILMTAEKHKLSIEMQTVQQDKVTRFKLVEMQVRGIKMSVPKEDLAEF
jgi:hypothetical protein